MVIISDNEKNLYWIIIDFLSLSSLSMSMACEIFKEPIGTSLSSIIDKYDNLDEPPENNAEIYTYHKCTQAGSFVKILT